MPEKERVVITKEYGALPAKKVQKEKVFVGVRGGQPQFEHRLVCPCPHCGTKLVVLQNPGMYEGMPYAFCKKGCPSEGEVMLLEQ